MVSWAAVPCEKSVGFFPDFVKFFPPKEIFTCSHLAPFHSVGEDRGLYRVCIVILEV